MPSPSVVQRADAAVVTFGTNEPTATYGSATTAGNLLVALVHFQSGFGQLSSGFQFVMPSGWVRACHSTLPPQYTYAEIWYYPSNPGGITSVHVAYNQSTGINNSECGAILFEVQDAATSSPLDQSGGTHGSANPMTASGGGPDVQATDIVFALGVDTNNAPTGPAGYTNAANSADTKAMGSYRVNSSIVTDTATFGSTNGDDWAVAIASFLPSGGGGGPSDEQYANRIVSPATLSGSILSGAGSLVVSTAAPFPTVPQFRLRIDDEILLVTGITGGTTFAVTRGQEGSTAAGHSSGATVRHLLTAGGLLNLLPRAIKRGAHGGVPAGGSLAGRLYLDTDGNTLTYDDGAALDPHGPLFALTPVDPAAFAWTNQGGASEDTSRGFAALLAPGAAGDNLRIRRRAVYTAPYSVVVYLQPLYAAKAGPHAGVVWADATPHYFLAAVLPDPAGPTLAVLEYSDATTLASTVQSTQLPFLPGWLRVGDDGSNRTIDVSQDGQHWLNLYSAGRTTYITPTQIGYYANAGNAGTPNLDVGLGVLSWLKS